MTERWRCFVAVPIDASLRAALEAARAYWLDREDLHGLRWTDPDAWHITLVFLGDVGVDDVPGVIERTAAVARQHVRFRVPADGHGAFPSPLAARVVWYGVGDPDGALGVLAADLGTALKASGRAEFRPHITLARSRGRAVDVRGWLNAPEGTAQAEMFDIDRVELMRSHQARDGAAYETVVALPLADLEVPDGVSGLHPRLPP